MAWFLLTVLGLAVVGAIAVYNQLAQLRVTVDSACSDVDVQLKRRHDLVPNLVNVVRDYDTRLVQFPSNLVAGGFGFRRSTFFRLDAEEQRQVPTVSFPG